MSTATRDEGRIALLSLVLALLAMTLVLVVTSASAVHLQRKRLYALADAAAADAADALVTDAYYSGGTVELSDASVTASAERYLLRHGDLPGTVVGTGTGSPDGRTAVVELVVVVEPPFASVVPEEFARVRLVATAGAQAQLS
jgi:hypothetical protein